MTDVVVEVMVVIANFHQLAAQHQGHDPLSLGAYGQDQEKRSTLNGSIIQRQQRLVDSFQPGSRHSF